MEHHTEWEEEFDERFRPIDFCNTGDDKMTYVEQTRNELKDFIRTTIAHAKAETVKTISEKIEGMKKVETKHDRCTLDDCYCYDHKETMKDEDYPNGAYDYNTAIDDILSIINE